MLIADTSGLLAFFDRSEPRHAKAAAVVRAERGPLVVSPYVVAELDYLVTMRWGVDRELAILEELASGNWELACLDEDALASAAGVVERYRDQRIGVADASIVVVADQRRTDRILTLDRRHFEVLYQGNGRPFTILPA